MVWGFGRGMKADAGSTSSDSRDPGNGFWFEGIGRKTAAGELVTIDQARNLPVVRDCLQVLGQTIAGLTYGMFEILPDGSRKRVENHPVLTMLKVPNATDTDYDFLFQMVDDLASAGRWLAVKAADGSLWRICPEYVVVQVLEDRRLRFQVTEPGRPQRTYLDDEVWYIALPPKKTDFTGRSPILDDGREAIGSALAIQNYGAAFFANDATPPFFFKYKGNFKDKESKRNFLDGWKGWLSGRNRRSPAVLEYDMDVKQLAQQNDQAQFLESRKEGNLDLTRLWRMPPHKVGILDQAHQKNIEQQAIEFVTDTIGPMLELIEASIEKWFLENDPTLCFEFNVWSLLRGDLKSRFDAYAIGRQWGWLSVNDILKMENQNGIGTPGDRYIEPLNMQPVGSKTSDVPPAED